MDPPKLCGRWQAGHLCEAGANQSSENPHGECGGVVGTSHRDCLLRQSGLGGQLGANCTLISPHVP